MGKKKINWKVHFIELVTVVIGISLAFMLNRSYETGKARSAAETSLNSIIEEIKRNKVAVDSGLIYHTELLEQIRNDPSNVRMTIQASSVDRHAWELSKTTEMYRLMDYELYLKLTKIYNDQQSLTAIIGDASTLINSITVWSLAIIDLGLSTSLIDESKIKNENKGLWTQGWTGIFETMIGMEKNLSTSYSEVLVELEAVKL